METTDQVTVSHYSRTFLAEICQGIRPKSQEIYQLGMSKFVNFFPERHPLSFESADIGAWMRHLMERHKPRSIHHFMHTVRRFFVWMVDAQIITDDKLDIFQRRKLPKIPRVINDRQVITPEQHRFIMAYIRRGKVKIWWTTACTVAWHTGLRMSDIADLRWDAIDWSQEIINVTPLKTRRLGKSVSIPMDEELAEHLMARKNEPYYPSEWVIPDMHGYYHAPHGGSYLTNVFRYICKSAGCPGLHIHCYRHAFVSRLINAGVEPLIISSMSGHSVEEVETYAHVSDQAKREALDKARSAMYRAKLKERGIQPVIYTPNDL